MQPDKHGNRYFLFAQERLHGARKPDDWLRWLLNLAATTSDEALAQHCFQGVARAVIDTKPTSFDVPSKEEIESWVAEHATQWPNAPQWLEGAWSSSLEEIECRQRDNADVKHGQAQQLQWREERKRQFEPLLAALLTSQK
jgi:hypothetical protein